MKTYITKDLDKITDCQVILMQSSEYPASTLKNISFPFSACRIINIISNETSKYLTFLAVNVFY